MTTAVRLVGDALELPGDVRVRFIRTLRLPEQGTYPLPPGLGSFPLRRVADYPDTVPGAWRQRGGVMLPVYRREAMWLNFSAQNPAALQVGVGKVCAVSGRPWTTKLLRHPQNYVPLPQQPWLDGINSGQGTVRQFVALPTGYGATVEGQITGSEEWGGVQLAVHGLTEAAYKSWKAQLEPSERLRGATPGAAPVTAAGAPPTPGAVPGAPPAAGAAPLGSGARALGLGAGGTMRQEVYADSRPIVDYRAEADGRVFVHLVPAVEWPELTGEPAPSTPVTADSYVQHGLPWFDYYDADAADLPPTEELGNVRPTGDWPVGAPPDPVGPHPVTSLGAKPVPDGRW